MHTPEFDPNRREGMRWDRKARVLRSRGEIRREAKTAEIIEHGLRESFPNTHIDAHPQPRKKK